MKAKVTHPFSGCPDGQAHPVKFVHGDEIEGDLAKVAIREGWAVPAHADKPLPLAAPPAPAPAHADKLLSLAAPPAPKPAPDEGQEEDGANGRDVDEGEAGEDDTDQEEEEESNDEPQKLPAALRPAPTKTAERQERRKGKK